MGGLSLHDGGAPGMRRSQYVIRSTGPRSRGQTHEKFQWKPVYTFATGALVGGTAWYYQSHREAVPISGRMRFVNLPKSIELELGRAQWEATLEAEKDYIRRGNVEVAIKKILTTLSTKSGIAGFEDTEWNVIVVDKPIQNAFVLPGGYCVVYTGLLPICANYNGLATVLSHEASHVLARHAAERI